MTTKRLLERFGRTAALGAVVLALAGTLLWLVRRERGLVVVVPRTVRDLWPPWAYASDQTRLLGLVVEYLCPAQAEAGSAYPSATVAESCEPARDGPGVVVRLRPNLVRGAGGVPVAAQEVATALADVGIPGATPAGPGRLLVRPDPGQTDSALLDRLATAPVAFSPEGDRRPEGTGPFFVRAYEKQTAGSRPPMDTVVLRRRKPPFGGLREIVFHGLGGGPRAARWLRHGLDSGRVHLALDRGGRERGVLGHGGNRWELVGAPPDRVLIAAVPPSDRLPEPHRRRLVCLLHGLARDSSFHRSVGARPAVRLLPEPFPLLPYQRLPGYCSELPDGQGAPPPRPVVLLTNDGWGPEAREIARRLEQAWRGLRVELVALPPAAEDERRNRGDYDVSVLSLVYEPLLPVAFLADDLGGWSKADARRARNLADREAAGTLRPEEIAALLSDLDDRFVALAQPPTFHAVNRRLVGYDARLRVLDPRRLELVRPYPTLLVGLSLLVAGLLAAAATTMALRSRKANALRRALGRRVEALHHEFSSPLAAIKAHADLLASREPEAAGEIRAEADAALDLVDRTRWAFGGAGQGELATEGTCDLLREVVRPLAERLREQARLEGVEPASVEVRAPANLPAVGLAPVAARRVVSNLLENAHKYRGDSGLRVEVVCEPEGSHVACRVRDWGTGIPPGLDERLLLDWGYRVESAPRSALPGSGLGLAIVYEVLRRAGGEIRLTNRHQPTELVAFLPADQEPGEDHRR